MSLFKYIGLGILGLGGVSSVAALSSSRVRKFVGISSVISQSSPSIPSSTPDVSVSDLSEEDRQGQFLYELSKKIFRFLKDKKKGGADQKENVVKGLKDKFNGSLESEEDTWENFKSLCEAQKTKETNDAPNVDNEYSRLCFLDENTEIYEYNPKVKGRLINWGEKLDYCEFYEGQNSNFELGTKFQTLHSDSNPIDVFNDGLNTNPERIKDFFEEKIPSDPDVLFSSCQSLFSD